MSDLLKNSNALWIKERPVAELVDENVSLNLKNRLLWATLVGLSAFSVLSVSSCSSNAKALNQSCRENQDLKERIACFQKDAADLALENQGLKSYAEDAQSFALGIRPWLDENDSGCEDPNCAACKKMEQENNEKLKTFSKAMDILGIDEKILSRLQEGYEK